MSRNDLRQLNKIARISCRESNSNIPYKGMSNYNPTQFASVDAPLRASSLPSLLACPMRAVLLDAKLLGDEVGEAAETGSAMHAIAHEYHTTTKSVEQAIGDVTSRDGQKFPRADWPKAAKWSAAYCSDPRNRRDVALHSELFVSGAFDPAPHDVTRQLVYVRGTLDQIRRDQHGRYYVLDLKTGATQGMAMLDCYAAQLAAYTLMMQAALGLDDDEVAPPAVARIRGYEGKGVDPTLSPPGVFYPSEFSVAVCRQLIEEVTNVVADVRNGRVDFVPGFQCSTICPARGSANCLQKFEILRQRM